MDFLRMPVWGGLNLLQVLSIAAGALLIFLLLRFFFRMVARQTPSAHWEARMKCRDCGWIGVVSRYKPACRRCGKGNLRPG